MLIDFHVPVYDEPGYGEALAEAAQNLGAERFCIMGGDGRYGLAADAEVLRLADAYPEMFVAFAHVDLADYGASRVERMKRVGFAGLCVWAPPAPYDDESFFPVYEAAQALGMPVIFHTGFMPPTALDRARRVRSENMRPVYLDTIARYCPALKIVGLGLGNPWCEEAAEAMRHHSNVFFDLSGDILRRRGGQSLAEFFQPAQASLWEEDTGGSLWGHVLFGSGVRHEDMAAVERDYERTFRSLAVSRDDMDAVMGNTAAKLLGIPVGS